MVSKLVLFATILSISCVNVISEEIQIVDHKIKAEDVFSNDTLLKGLFFWRDKPTVTVKADEGDKYLNTTQLIQKYNYTAEEYSVVTEDGYILSLIRIVGTGPALFLMHGFPSSSDGFVTSGPNSLAFTLASAGYDVWLGNARGSKYSINHEILPTDSREYWDFTFHESGVYDLTAMIDMVLDVTNQTQLIYIGHAQGTTSFFIMCSLIPEYNNKIQLFIALAPVAYIWHLKSPTFLALVPLREQEYAVSQALGLYQFLDSNPFTVFLTSVVCSSSRVAILFCSSVIFSLFGYDYSQIDYVNAPVQLSHFPAGSSFKNAVHYLQLVASKKFAMFDYGEEGNLARYNSTTPPDYPVELVTAPVVGFYADNDYLSVLDDIKQLFVRLDNVIDLIRVPYSTFNHFDFLWGKDAKTLVYDTIVNILNTDLSIK